MSGSGEDFFAPTPTRNWVVTNMAVKIAALRQRLRLFRVSLLLCAVPTVGPVFTPSFVTAAEVAPPELQAAIADLRQVAPNGTGHERAIAAATLLQQGGEAALLPVLEGMREATPLAKNWLRVVASDLLDRAPLPRPRLQAFFDDRANDADARYLVFRWLVRGDAELEDALLKRSCDDPSLPLRFRANALRLQTAKGAREASPEEAKQLYQQVLDDARNPEQLKEAADVLNEMGGEINLAQHLGMFARWYCIGPFDSAGGVGFENVVGPESLLVSDGETTIDFEKSMLGRNGTVEWKVVSTTDQMGSLDLNPPFENAKEAAVYAYCEFESPVATEAEARIGSTNANKVWINGALVTANEVYHAGSMIDQYTGSCAIKEGKNWVLVKVCQNNQTESWAQDYQFQFRITDATGKPLPLQIDVPASSNE